MIDGKTAVFGLLADPITQVRTPHIVNQAFEARGVNAIVVPFHVSAKDLQVFWQGIICMKSLAGVIVTVPHKGSVASLADELFPAAQQIGAANVIRREADGRMVANMFDGQGYVAGLKAEGYDLQGKKVLLSGAGGAASAIAFALASEGVGHLRLANRTSSKASALAERIKGAYPNMHVSVTASLGGDADIIINGTSLGMQESDTLPIDLAGCGQGQVVGEVIMKPEKTLLLKHAEELGCSIHHGHHMLMHQVALITNFLLEGRKI